MEGSDEKRSEERRGEGNRRSVATLAQAASSSVIVRGSSMALSDFTFDAEAFAEAGIDTSKHEHTVLVHFRGSW